MRGFLYGLIIGALATAGGLWYYDFLDLGLGGSVDEAVVEEPMDDADDMMDDAGDMIEDAADDMVEDAADDMMDEGDVPADDGTE